jgi:hypothetical protein
LGGGAGGGAAGADAGAGAAGSHGEAGAAGNEVVDAAPDIVGEEARPPDPDVSSEGDGDRNIGPTYTRDPLTNAVASVPHGQVISFTMSGATSTIYKGSYTRRVSIYVPRQYVPGTPAPLMVTQDAMGRDVLPNVLDNLIDAKKLPKIVVFFVDNGGGDAVGSERGLEYDTVSGLYAEYVDKEVLPRGIIEVKTQLNIDLALTADPEGRGTLGGSSGGAGSFSMAWWHPDLFTRVLTYSGTFVNQVPASSPFPHGCWVYHDVDPYDPAAPNGLIVRDCEPAGGFKGSSNPGPCDTPLTQAACQAVTGCAWNTKVNRRLRIWHESADRDLGAGGGPGSYRNFDLANQRMAASFKARGYHYHYDHAAGAGHVDPKVVNQTLPEAMLWLWRGYPIE